VSPMALRELGNRGSGLGSSSEAAFGGRVDDATTRSQVGDVLSRLVEVWYGPSTSRLGLTWLIRCYVRRLLRMCQVCLSSAGPMYGA
jgi:hypothetical protein